jgi:hypothetical protein
MTFVDSRKSLEHQRRSVTPSLEPISEVNRNLLNRSIRDAMRNDSSVEDISLDRQVFSSFSI